MVLQLLRFSTARTGLLIEDDRGDASPRVLDIHDNLPCLEAEDRPSADVMRGLLPETVGSWTTIIERWDEAEPALESLRRAACSAAESGPAARWSIRSLDRFELAPPMPSSRSTIYAAGANFADHASRAFSAVTGDTTIEASSFLAEREAGLPPWGFLVPPKVLLGHQGTVIPPRGVKYLDYEAEVAAIIGKGGRDLGADEVGFVGFSAWNDFSIRDPHLISDVRIDRGPLVWALQKNFTSGKAFGPTLALSSAADVDHLGFDCRLNGGIVQASSTDNMIYRFSEIAAFISRYIELEPGDIITSGTPAGTAVESGTSGNFLREGDEVEVRVAGLPGLVNRVGHPR